MRVCVYTCVTNSYDELHSPLFHTEDVDYLCFTDGTVEVPVGWKSRRLEANCSSPRDANRYIKILPHLSNELSEYDLTIYIDGSIDVVGKLDELIHIVMESKDELFFYDHPARNCAYEELVSCFETYKIPYRFFRIAFNCMIDNDVPINAGLFECGVIVRKKSSNVDRLMNAWWNFYSKGVYRDQIALVCAITSSAIQPCSLGLPDHRFQKKYFMLKSGHSGDLIKRHFAWWIWRPFIKILFFTKLINMDACGRKSDAI